MSDRVEFGPARKPDVEFKRELRPGTFRVYGHIYWRPLIIVLFGKVLIGRRTLKRAWKDTP